MEYIIGKQNIEIYRTLLWRSLKRKYKGSMLGFAWVLLHPALTSLVLYTVFFLLLGRKEEYFMLFLLSGLLPWNFLVNGTMNMMSSMRSNAGLIRSVQCPRIIFPMVMLGATLTEFFAVLVLIPPFYFFYNFTVPPQILLLPLIIILNITSMIGLGLILSLISVYFRDIHFVIQTLFRLLFFLSPVFYPIYRIPSEYLNFYLLNPAASLLTLYRWCLMGETSVSSFLPWPYIWLLIAESFCIMLAGIFVFRKYENTMIKLL